MKLRNLSKEILVNLYIRGKKSMDDIACLYGVSRVAIYKKIKKYGIMQRSKSHARLEAQKQGKVPQDFFKINENFFDSWSPKMAYILGLISTVGCITKTGIVSLAMKDKELIEKVRQMLESEHKIEPSRQRSNLYIFHFSRKKIVDQLRFLGITPRKSLTLKFPNVPIEHLPDFIRGVFDGDGSVYFVKRKPKPLIRSKFVSSSKDFIQGLNRGLDGLGMPKRNVYSQKTKNGYSYMFTYGHKDSAKLFKILYQNSDLDGAYLKRKYRVFSEGLREA